MKLVNAKMRLNDPRLMDILAPSMFNPTPKRVAARAATYRQETGVEACACQIDDIDVGLILFSVSEDTAVIHQIATARTHRGVGVGRFMIEQVMEGFHLLAMAAETDDDAVGFYRRCGFTVERCGAIGGRARYRCRRERPTP